MANTEQRKTNRSTLATSVLISPRHRGRSGTGVRTLRKFNADLLTAILSTGIGVTVLAVMPAQGGSTATSALRNLQSIALFPTVAGVLMTVLGLTLLVQAVADQKAGAGVHVRFGRPAYVFAAMAMVVVYAAAIRLIGMSAASVLAILGLGLLIEIRHWKLVIPAAILVPIGVGYLFGDVLRILLPRGILFH
jgi:hypothetical protein